MLYPLLLIVIGLITGIYGGVMGLGGGTVMIPMLVLLLGFSQHQAVATSLAAMIPPVTLPAVIRMHGAGHVSISTALYLAIGIAAGAWLGASIATKLSDFALRLIFGFVLIYVAGYTILNAFGKDQLLRNMLGAALLVVLAAGALALMLKYSPAA